MPIPKDGKKAQYIGSNKNENSKYQLLKGMKGIAVKHIYNINDDEVQFYPNTWKGYCITVTKTDLKQL